jgi:hypothetical protein
MMLMFCEVTGTFLIWFETFCTFILFIVAVVIYTRHRFKKQSRVAFAFPAFMKSVIPVAFGPKLNLSKHFTQLLL